MLPFHDSVEEYKKYIYLFAIIPHHSNLLKKDSTKKGPLSDFFVFSIDLVKAYLETRTANLFLN